MTVSYSSGTLGKMKILVGRLGSLLDDSQPGLSTWVAMLEGCLEELITVAPGTGGIFQVCQEAVDAADWARGTSRVAKDREGSGILVGSISWVKLLAAVDKCRRYVAGVAAVPKQVDGDLADFVDKLAGRSLDPDIMDDLVHDLAIKTASDVNNAGLGSQVAFVAGAVGEDLVRSTILEAVRRAGEGDKVEGLDPKENRRDNVEATG